ncbi:MAG: M20/M25/M40 family metallo-hydrolase [Trueperaceae bacterium]
MGSQTAERLRADVAALISGFEDRRVGSAGHLAAREWAHQRLREMGLKPYKDGEFVLPYGPEPHGAGPGSRFANVVGVVPAAPGADPAAKPWVLGAHYDTVPFTPGADDNAASIAVVLEVAARLLERPVSRPVVVPIFDAEEPPYFHSDLMGSVRFVQDHSGPNVHAAVILDLIAHAIPAPGLEDLVGLMGAESHPAWADSVRAVAQQFGPAISLPNEIMADMSDHYAFRLAGVPFMFFSSGQGPHYHQPSDNMANLDLNKAVRVADMVEGLIRGADSLPFDGARQHDASPLDHELLQGLLGPAGLAGLGISSSADVRRGLQNLVGVLLQPGR